MTTIQERRFFYPFDPDMPTITIDGDESYHIKTVLRAKIGEEIEIVNGQGDWCHGKISGIKSNSITVTVIKKTSTKKPPIHTLFCPSLLRSHGMNWMIEKLAEIGVDQIQPVIYERTDIRPRDNMVLLSLQKWLRIAAQAIKVNRRLWITEIFPPIPLERLLQERKDFPNKYFLDPHGIKFKKWEYPAMVLIGPPGDFSQKEIEQIRNAGFLGIKVNDSILKTETAALSMAALLQYD